jgi:ferrochelatase
LELRNKETTGILLLNLGGPDSLRAVKPFLYNLFSDREIIKLGPSFLQTPLAWLISSLRSGKTEHMYKTIGGKSPLCDITEAQAKALEESLNSTFLASDSSHNFKVYIGMRYWHPFIADTVSKVLDDGLKRLIVLTLYPHYSKATTGSAISEFKRATRGRDINIEYIEQWYDFPPYIDSLAELMHSGISEFNVKDIHVLFSAHSLPETFIREGDPYVDHVRASIKEIMMRLSWDPYNISGLHWHLAFQSKSGPVKWLQPATDDTIIKLAKTGVKNVFVVPISFVSDHIETLYEIDMLYKEVAVEHGITLKRCHSLNTSNKFIAALKELVLSKIT